ncbi:MAG TPA: protein kinase [Polyangiaceae bacterium]|nr:protein kinase [Polyangiaceae bacterium]
MVAETSKFFFEAESDDAQPDDEPGILELPRAPHSPLSPGTHVSRYVISEVIGIGAAGMVYGAYDPGLRRKIALKLLRTDPGRERDLDQLKERLLREGQAMARLSHPNVVTVFDVGTYGDQVFIVMELVLGQTLGQWLGEREQGWIRIRDVFVDAGRGLAAAHEQQLVHRDFKPANVLVGRDGRARVTDFGLARRIELVRDSDAPSRQSSSHDLPYEVVRHRPPLLTLTATGEGGLTGTPSFMAPEQFTRRRTDARTDQFSYCVALYMALYGSHPFMEGANGAEALQELATNVIAGRLRSASAPGVPDAVFDILRRGLSVAPKDRFPTMNALIAALLVDKRVEAAAPKPRRVVVALAGTVTLVAFGLAWASGNLSSRSDDRATPVVPGAGELVPLTAEPSPPDGHLPPTPAIDRSTTPSYPTSDPVKASPVTKGPARRNDRKATPAKPSGRERYYNGLKEPF